MCDQQPTRHERHRFEVNGRRFALDIDHGHKPGCCMLPPVPASIVWWENVSDADTLNCGNSRTCLMIENA